MGISVDGTFAIQIFSFLILWAVLKRLLFEPMLDVLDKREERTRGSLELASRIHADVAAMRSEYEAHIREARDQSLRELEESRKLTTAEERTILGAARDQAAARLTLARAEIGRQVEAARDQLHRDAAGLSRQLVQQVVGRPLP